MDIFEKCEKRSRVDEAKELGIYPYFHALESRQDTVVQMEGKRRIMLGSNNYLGLTTDPQVIEAGIHALERLLRFPISQWDLGDAPGAGGGAGGVPPSGGRDDLLHRVSE